MLVFNVFTGRLDYVSDLSGYFLLDQSTPQHVTGTPYFDDGIRLGFAGNLVFSASLGGGYTVGGGMVWNGDSGMTLQVGGGNVFVADSMDTFLPRLVTNGFVKTTASGGKLSIDTNSYMLSNATLQTVTNNGASTSNGITITDTHLPQLTLGAAGSATGTILLQDSNATAHTVTVNVAKLTTASYTAQHPDNSAGTHLYAFGSGGANQLTYWSSGSDMTGNKVFTVNASTPSLQIGSAGSTGAVLIFSQNVSTVDRLVTFGASTTTTAAVTYRLPPTKPASFTQVMTMDTSGNMGILARSSAYTQTYSTAARTVNAYTTDPESSAYTGIDNAQAGTPYAQLADLNSLRTAYENLRASHDNVIQVLNAVIDDLQTANILG